METMKVMHISKVQEKGTRGVEGSEEYELPEVIPTEGQE